MKKRIGTGPSHLIQQSKDFFAHWEPCLQPGRTLFYLKDSSGASVDIQLMRRSTALCLQSPHSVTPDATVPPRQSLYIDDDLQFEDLIDEVTVSPSGTLTSGPGPLRKILFEGGVLILNMDTLKKPELLNSLFDVPPTFGGERVSENLTIIGIIAEKSVREERYSPAFFSRWQKKQDFKGPSLPSLSGIAQEATPAASTTLWSPLIQLKPNDAQLEVDPKNSVDLHHMPGTEIEPLLLGRIKLGAKTTTFEQGPLAEAIFRGDKTFVIKNPGKDPKTTKFFETLFTKKSIRINGQDVALPEEFTLFSVDAPPSQKTVAQLQERVRISVFSDDSGIDPSKLATKLLNGNTFNDAFHLFTSQKGQLVEIPGILDSLTPEDTLRVSTLAHWQWRLLFEAILTLGRPVNLLISHEESLPPEYCRIKCTTLPSTASTPELSFDAFCRNLNEPGSSILISNDPGLTWETIKKTIAFSEGKPPILESITRKTTFDTLFFRWNVSGDGYSIHTCHLLKALEAEQTVVLQNLSENPALRNELASMFTQRPYLLVNGNPVYLPGKLIVLEKDTAPASQERRQLSGPPFVHNVSAADSLAMFKSKHPKKTAKFSELETLYHWLSSVKKKPLGYHALETMAASVVSDSERAPEDAYRKFRKGVLGEFQNTPAYPALKVMTRLLLFQKASASHLWVKGDTLETLVHRFSSEEDFSKNIWKIAQCFSPAALAQIWELPQTVPLNDVLTFEYGAPVLNPDLSQKLIAAAKLLVAKRISESLPALQSHYTRLLHFPTEAISPSLAKIVDRPDESGTSLAKWNKKIGDCVRFFKNNKYLNLEGVPGVGKSHIRRDLVERLRSEETPVDVYEMTLGGSTTEEDLFYSVQTDPNTRASTITKQAVADWIQNENPRTWKLLCLDEANLVTDQLLERLRAGFENSPPGLAIDGRFYPLTENHKILLTGNPLTMVGRTQQALIQDHFTTFHFKAFSPEFLTHVLMLSCLPKTLNEQDRMKVAQLMTECHHAVSKIDEKRTLSVRDLQEVATRFTLAYTGVPMDLETKVLHAVLEVYTSALQPGLVDGLKTWMQLRYNRTQESLDARPIMAHDSDYHHVHREMSTDSAFTHLPSTDELGYAIFRDVRRWETAPTTPGKLGRIIEGNSGRGKDALLRRVLESMGYKDAGHAERDTAKESQLYICLNAGKPDEMKAQITRAKAMKGKRVIVIFSEMNLVESRHLEGFLNDLQGTLIFATMNATSFKGRQPFSGALLNRFIHTRVVDYTPSEYKTLLMGGAPSSPWCHLSEDVKQAATDIILGVHFELIRRLARANHSTVPTLREVLFVKKALESKLPPDTSFEALVPAIDAALKDQYDLHLRILGISYETLMQAMPAKTPEGTRQDLAQTQDHYKTLLRLIGDKDDIPTDTFTAIEDVLVTAALHKYGLHTHRLSEKAQPIAKERERTRVMRCLAKELPGIRRFFKEKLYFLGIASHVKPVDNTLQSLRNRQLAALQAQEEYERLASEPAITAKSGGDAEKHAVPQIESGGGAKKPDPSQAQSGGEKENQKMPQAESGEEAKKTDPSHAQSGGEKENPKTPQAESGGGAKKQEPSQSGSGGGKENPKMPQAESGKGGEKQEPSQAQSGGGEAKKQKFSTGNIRQLSGLMISLPPGSSQRSKQPRPPKGTCTHNWHFADCYFGAAKQANHEMNAISKKAFFHPAPKDLKITDCVTLTIKGRKDIFRLHKNTPLLLQCLVPSNATPSKTQVLDATGNQLFSGTPIQHDNGRWFIEIPLDINPDHIKSLSYNISHPKVSKPSEATIQKAHLWAQKTSQETRQNTTVDEALWPEWITKLKEAQSNIQGMTAPQIRTMVHELASFFASGITYSLEPAIKKQYEDSTYSVYQISDHSQKDPKLRNMMNLVASIRQGCCYEHAYSLVQFIQTYLPTIPIRVAAGFCSESEEISGTGHGWSEIFFDEIGWEVVDKAQSSPTTSSGALHAIPSLSEEELKKAEELKRAEELREAQKLKKEAELKEVAAYISKTADLHPMIDKITQEILPIFFPDNTTPSWQRVYSCHSGKPDINRLIRGEPKIFVRTEETSTAAHALRQTPIYITQHPYYTPRSTSLFWSSMLRCGVPVYVLTSEGFVKVSSAVEFVARIEDLTEMSKEAIATALKGEEDKKTATLSAMDMDYMYAIFMRHPALAKIKNRLPYNNFLHTRTFQSKLHYNLKYNDDWDKLTQTHAKNLYLNDIVHGVIPEDSGQYTELNQLPVTSSSRGGRFPNIQHVILYYDKAASFFSMDLPGLTEIEFCDNWGPLNTSTDKDWTATPVHPYPSLKTMVIFLPHKFGFYQHPEYFPKLTTIALLAEPSEACIAFLQKLQALESVTVHEISEENLATLQARLGSGIAVSKETPQ